MQKGFISWRWTNPRGIHILPNTPTQLWEITPKQPFCDTRACLTKKPVVCDQWQHNSWILTQKISIPCVLLWEHKHFHKKNQKVGFWAQNNSLPKKQTSGLKKTFFTIKKSSRWQMVVIWPLVNRVSHFYIFFELSLVLLTTQAHRL